MRYVWRDGHFRDPRTGEKMPLPKRREISAPVVISDIKEYRSPIDGRLIGSRSARRYDLEANGCVEADPPAKPKGYQNPTFTRKRGLPLNERARDTLKT